MTNETRKALADASMSTDTRHALEEIRAMNRAQHTVTIDMLGLQFAIHDLKMAQENIRAARHWDRTRAAMRIVESL